MRVFSQENPPRRANVHSRQEPRDSRALVNAVGHSTPNHLAVLDAAGTVITANAAWEDCAARQRPGCAVLPRSAVGLNYPAMMSEHPARSTRAQAGTAAVFEGRVPQFSMDYVCGSSNCGGEHRFNMTVSALRATLGGAVVVHTDITDRWRADEAAQRGAGIHRSMLAALVEGVIVYDNLGNVIDRNPAADLILGDSPTWMRGRNDESAASQSIRPDGTAIDLSELPLMRVLSSKEPCRHVVTGNRHTDGTITWLIVNAEPVLDAESGDLLSVVVSFADITDQCSAQQQLSVFRHD